MKYIALLRGINVGGKRKVEMKRLRDLFVSLGYRNVVTYLNSGNLIFESEKDLSSLQKVVPNRLKDEFRFELPTLIKEENDIVKIAKAIPEEWMNNAEQKTDIAYLFPDIDSKELLDEMPFNKEFIHIKYITGALIWNLKKRDYTKSHLNKIVSKEQYQRMTVRNVNTARFLAGLNKL